MCRIDDLSELDFTTLVDRMNGKYLIRSGCWPWTASVTRGGYGRLALPKPTTEGWVSAHRVMYSSHYNTMLGDWQVLHKCDNPSCVNPKHLFLGTQYDNVNDMIAKGRRITSPGEANGSAILTEQDIIEIRILINSKSNKDIAKQYGVSYQNINHIIKRESWKHVK